MNSPAALKADFESYMQAEFQQPKWQGALYRPMTYFLETPGKRYRPVLLLLTYQAVTGASPEKAMDAAMAVELFHNFTLLHDDLMDGDPIRRGKPTVHVKFGDETAILSGDAMFALTFEMLIRQFPDAAAALIKEYTRISVEVCEGQMDDMLLPNEPIEAVPIRRTLEMLRQKTAVLLGGAMSLGAICGGANPEDVSRFREFGEAVGLGFQLQDDYLDVYGNQEKLGKRVGTDILENKKTVLMLTAFERANPAQKARLEALLVESDPATKIKGVKDLFEELEVAAATKSLIASYFEKARSLGQELAHLPGYVPIGQFFEALMQREY